MMSSFMICISHQIRYIITVIKSRRIRWAGHVARMRENNFVVNVYAFKLYCLITLMCWFTGICKRTSESLNNAQLSAYKTLFSVYTRSCIS
jgi:hypothetical protein